MKKLYLFVFLLLSGLFFSQAFTYNGISYSVISPTNSEVQVDKGNYQGDIIIPEFVSYNGKTFTVTNLSERAFEDCFYATSISLPKTVRSSMGINYYNCLRLTTINVDPNNPYLRSIDGILFTKDLATLIAYPISRNVQEFTIPEGTVTISRYAFQESYGLQKLNFSSTLKNLPDGGIFFSNLSHINVPESNLYFSSTDGVLFNKDQTWLIQYPPTKIVNDYFIPETVKVIKFQAFSYAAIKTLHIGKNVQYIEDRVFHGITDLESVIVDKANTSFESLDGVLFTITKSSLVYFPRLKNISEYNVPKEVHVIDDYSFNYNLYVQKLVVNEGAVRIDNSAFYGSNFKTLYLPSTLKTVYNSVSVRPLTDVYISASTPPSLPNGEDTFYLMDLGNINLYVPVGTASKYKAAPGWMKFNIIELETLNVNDVKNNGSQITVYPNPVSDRLMIKSTERVKKVNIMNASGQYLYSGSDTEVDLQHFVPGIYIVRVESGNGEVVNKKIIKK